MTTAAFTIEPLMAQLVRCLEGMRFPLTTETAVQAAIGETLEREGIAYLREHRFSAADRVDFWCAPVAIEVKLRGAKRGIYRQCERYCEHAEVGALILASLVPLNLGRLSKPVAVVNLGRAWL